MARICDIYDIIDAVAPFSTALDFDNSGLLVGDGNTVVTRALLALDITPAVVEEAASMNANLILAHHPVIFHPLKALAPKTWPISWPAGALPPCAATPTWTFPLSAG